MDRDTHLLSLRPNVVTEETTGIEQFQNTILRPILKFQHDLFIQILHASPLPLKQLSKIDNERDYHLKVKKLLTNDVGLRMTLIGSVVGLMTSNEYIAYAKNQKEINKRIITMLAKRYTDTWINGMVDG